MQARQARQHPPEAEASQADAVAQRFSVGSGKEDSRSYLIDPSAMLAGQVYHGAPSP